tara:strand:- start:134 stop:649 length:516 start_codon:yes stop_codon:yes gene_type:complete
MSALTNANVNGLPHPDDVIVPRFSRSSTQAINAYVNGLVDSTEINSKGQLSLKENRLTNKDTPYGRQTMEPRFPLADLAVTLPTKPPAAPRAPGIDVTQRVLAPEIRSLEEEHKIKDVVIAQLVRDHQAAREENRALRAKVAYLERLAQLLTNVIDSFCELFHVQNPTESA